MLANELKPFTSEELYDFRKVLVDWKWRGPEAVYYVLSQLCKGTLEREALLRSKLYKSVYLLKDTIKKAPKEDLALYNKDQVTNILLKLKSLNNQIKETVTKPIKKDKQKTVYSAAKYSDAVQVTQTNIHLGDYLTQDQRDKVKLKLQDQLFKLSLQKEEQHYFDEATILSKCEKLATDLESTLYSKHLSTVAPEKNFASDLKTLHQYLVKDKTGTVLHKLFEGLFTVSQACELSLKDWLDEEVIRELENRNISSIYDDDADFYRQIRIKEMTQSKGQECPRCHNYFLYVIDTKQTRRADEPATIYYECFACNHRYRV